MADRSEVLAGNRDVQGTSREEADMLSTVLTGGRETLMHVGKSSPILGAGAGVHGNVSWSERKTEKLYSRFGIRGSDIIYHFHMKRYPTNMNEILADCFLDIVGSTQGIEAAFVDTHEFEERPHYWAVIAKGWADNPLASDKMGDELVSLLEKKIEE